MASRLLASTRARILVAALALLAGTIALSVVANRALLLARLEDRIDEDLAQEVGEFQRLAGGIDPETGEPFGTDVAAIFDTFFARNVPSADEEFLGLVGSRPYLRSANAPYALDEQADLVAAWAAAPRPAYGSATTPGGDVRWLVVPVSSPDGERLGTFVVARFPASERDEVDEAVRTAAAVGFVAFVAASALAWVIAGRVLAPLRHLADATRSVRQDHLDHRLPVEGTGELAELSRTFNDMLDRVEGAFAAQRSFLDDAGHELRTPITVIRGHLELADPSEPLGDATREVVFDELDRMARIVEDLLLIARAERPDFVVAAPVDVADLTAEILAKARPIGDRSWELRAGAVVVADLDRERVTQAWMNLVRNAVQHTEAGDRITVFSSVRGDELELGVVDTGEGVAPDDRERIFERFGRGTSARRTSADGAGLGLAIAGAIAAAHGGRLELRDTPGGGATFVLVLPAPAATPAVAAPTEEAAPWRGS
ncbi:MAG: ATP-binding protein [Acidimicrobiia bacterium]